LDGCLEHTVAAERIEELLQALDRLACRRRATNEGVVRIRAEREPQDHLVAAGLRVSERSLELGTVSGRVASLGESDRAQPPREGDATVVAGFRQDLDRVLGDGLCLAVVQRRLAG